MWLIIPIAIVLFLLWKGLSFSTMLGILIAVMITGGIGYAIGQFFSGGWAIYGALLGGVLGIAGAVGGMND